MSSPVRALLENPWGTLDRLVEGPLHPGGADATEQLLTDAGVTAGTRLLDVGCGSGGAVERAASRGARSVGLDHAPGTQRAIRGDLDAIPVADGTMDVVLAECALCLADEFSGAVAETRRVLRPDGRLALSDVVVDAELSVPEPVARLLCLTGARDRTRVTGAVERAGFEITQMRDHGDQLLSMRDRIEQAVDYERLLGAMGDDGKELLDGIERVERAVEDGTVGYVSLIAQPR